jgi:DNA-binding response OmpR family regulator
MKSKKILLVDDESDITESFGIALEDSGFEVDEYNDPAITSIGIFFLKDSAF